MILQLMKRKRWLIVILIIGSLNCGNNIKNSESGDPQKKPVLRNSEKYFVEELAYKKKVLLRESRRKKTKNPSIKSLDIPDVSARLTQPSRVVLDNGLTIYLLKNHEIPIIHLTAYIKTAYYFDSAKKSGLTDLLARMLRAGGIRGMTIADMNQFLNDSNILIHTSVKDDVGILELKAIYNPDNADLKANFIKACKIFANLLQFPKLKKSKIGYKKKLIKTQLESLNKLPYYLANKAFTQSVYGMKHPFAQFPSNKSINNITYTDLKKSYNRYYHPNGIILTVNGNFDNQEMMLLLKDLFGEWQQQEISYPDIPIVPLKKSKIKYIYKDVPQSTIIMGHIGIKPDNADYFTLLMINDMLGSAPLSNMLFGRIRSQLGLAYYIESQIIMKMRSQGLIKIECQTDEHKVARVIQEVKRILYQLTEHKITESKLKELKKSFISSIISGLNTSHEVLHYYAIHECYGLAPASINHFISQINSITVDDFQRIAKKYFHPDRLIIVVVGRKPVITQHLIPDDKG